MIEAVHEENLAEFENYILLNPRGSYLQCSSWAEQNPSWHWRAYIRRNEYKRVTGVVSFLVRTIPVLPFQILYAGRGPLYDIGDYDTLRELLGALRTAAAEESAAIVRLDPPEDRSDKEVLELYETLDYERVKHRGVGPAHPRHNWVIETAGLTWEKLQRGFSAAQLQNMRIALRHNVEIRRGGKGLAKAFGSLVERSALRDLRQAETADYFSGLMDSFGDRAKIYLACMENRPVAGAVMILTGTRYECAARVDLSNPSVHAMSLLQAAIVQAAADSGCDSVTFAGTDPDPASDSYRLDSGLGGHAEDLIGELDWYVKPILGLVAKLVLRISAWFTRWLYFIRIR